MTESKLPHTRNLGTPIAPGGRPEDDTARAVVSGFGWGISSDAEKKIESVERNIRTAVQHGNTLVLR